jgi:hypothetical protein
LLSVRHDDDDDDDDDDEDDEDIVVKYSTIITGDQRLYK